MVYGEVEVDHGSDFNLSIDIHSSFFDFIDTDNKSASNYHYPEITNNDVIRIILQLLGLQQSRTPNIPKLVTVAAPNGNFFI